MEKRAESSLTTGRQQRHAIAKTVGGFRFGSQIEER